MYIFFSIYWNFFCFVWNLGRKFLLKIFSKNASFLSVISSFPSKRLFFFPFFLSFRARYNNVCGEDEWVYKKQKEKLNLKFETFHFHGRQKKTFFFLLLLSYQKLSTRERFFHEKTQKRVIKNTRNAICFLRRRIIKRLFLSFFSSFWNHHRGFGGSQNPS